MPFKEPKSPKQSCRFQKPRPCPEAEVGSDLDLVPVKLVFRESA